MTRFLVSANGVVRDRICPRCDVRVRHGNSKYCRTCRQQGGPDAIPLPDDFDQRAAQYDASVDPLALEVRCWCGAKGYIEWRYVPSLCESRCYEVCNMGHVTLMRRVGTHTYDQHDRALADQARQDAINAMCARTKRRNGTENPRGR